MSISQYIRKYLDPVWIRDRVREVESWTGYSKSARHSIINKLYEEHEYFMKKFPTVNYKPNKDITKE